MTLDRYFKKKFNDGSSSSSSNISSSVSESQPSTSGFKRRRESTSEDQFLWNMSHLPSSNISPLHFLFLFWLVNVCTILCI